MNDGRAKISALGRQPGSGRPDAQKVSGGEGADFRGLPDSADGFIRIAVVDDGEFGYADLEQPGVRRLICNAHPAAAVFLPLNRRVTAGNFRERPVHGVRSNRRLERIDLREAALWSASGAVDQRSAAMGVRQELGDYRAQFCVSSGLARRTS